MNIDMKTLLYLDCDIIAAILLIFIDIFFPIMIVTGHPVIGVIGTMLLIFLWFWCIVS